MKLPRISGAEAIRALEKIGYRQVRQRGSHVRLHHDSPPRPQARYPVPLHRELKLGLLRKILRDANLSVKEFVDLT